MKTFVVAALFVFVSSQALALQNQRIHSPYLGVRAIGMGDAFTAVADDYSGLLYNPAGLARFQEGQLNVGIRGMITPNALSTVKGVIDASKTTDAAQVLTAFNKYLGTHEATRVGVDAFWVRPGWGVAFIPIDSTVDLDIRGGGPTAGVNAYQDSTLAFGKAYNFGEKDSLSIGATAKVIYRAYFDKDLTPTDLASGSKEIVRLQDAKEGITLDADIGSMYTVQVPEEGWLSWLQYAKPTLGLVVRNVADYGFSKNLHLFGKDTANEPAKLERRVDFGTRWDLPEFWVFSPRFMFDMRDMGVRYASFRKCLHIGTELLWKVSNSLKGGYRMGLSQGYFSLGVSGTLWIFNLDLATYSEEIGTSESLRESRRYIAKLALDF